MKVQSALLALATAVVLATPTPVRAMCGCMLPVVPQRPSQQQQVAQQILNRASKVALIREGETTTLTMSNDVTTDYDEFGLVIPVPTVVGEKDVRVVDPDVFAVLEQLTNPRLLENWDPDPCPSPAVAALDSAPRAESVAPAPKASGGMRAADYGVKVEAHYDVGEYAIAVLSAKDGAGAGLMEWLNKFHYAVPKEAVPVLDSYIKQKMRFFVAKVNFKKLKSQGTTFLRPLQVRYQTPKFMLPVRLGTINASGPQELVVYALSQKGRIEATNYQTLRFPTGEDLPLYAKDQFDALYARMFDVQTKKSDMRAIFLEYVQRGGMDEPTARKIGLGWGKVNDVNAALSFTTTRLHFRYDRDHFPEDLVLQETADIEPFHVTFSVHHPSNQVNCPAGKDYLAALPARREKEALALARLTDGDRQEIRDKMGLGPQTAPQQPETPNAPPVPVPAEPETWWDRLWK